MKAGRVLRVLGGLCLIAALAALAPYAAAAEDNKGAGPGSVIDRIFSAGDDLVEGYIGEKNVKELANGPSRGHGPDRGPRSGGPGPAERRRLEEERRRQLEEEQRRNRRRGKKDDDCNTGVSMYALALPLVALLKKKRRP